MATKLSLSAASSLASAGLSLASKGQASKRDGRSRSTLRTGLCLLTDFPLRSSMETSVRSIQRRSRRWRASSLGFRAKTSATAARAAKQAVRGSGGGRSGLFYEALRIIRQVQPTWVVLENVEALRFSNEGRDLGAVLWHLRDCGYVGCWRVLDARHFGSPAARRRIFILAGLGRMPSLEFLADASPVERLPCTVSPHEQPRKPGAFVGHTLQASNSSSRISLGCELLVAHENGWRAMVERERISARHGIPCGMDDANLYARFGAGNSIHPAVAQWVAEKILIS